MRVMRENSPGAVVMLVANKSDVDKQRMVTAEVSHHFPSEPPDSSRVFVSSRVWKF